jgi:predicted aconitase with swiveling domain
MREFILQGHKVAKGKAEGEALVSRQPFHFLHQVDTKTGVVIGKDNDWKDISITGKILVFPLGRGSTACAYVLYEMARNGTQPKGIINLRADPVLAVGAIISNIPMIDKLDGNPIELIKTGDDVELDADSGMVRVRSRESSKF